MLTPFDVRDKKKEIARKLDAGSMMHEFQMPLSLESLTLELYKEVLEEIAHGSIDPKSLAVTALEPVE